GSALTSAAVTVQDSAPVLDSVSITPSGPTTNSVLTANVTSHDDDGDTVSYAYQRSEDRRAGAGQTAATLDLTVSGNGRQADARPVRGTAMSAAASGSALTSAAVTVQDSAPVLDSVTITPSGPTTNSVLTANVTSHDDDGDTVSYAYQ